MTPFSGSGVMPQGRGNNFNALRFAAALSVLFSHSYPLTFGGDDPEPLRRLSNGQVTLGHVAVMVFFAISGFLITRSFARSRSVTRFVIARALRLYPALIAVLALLAYGFGPLLSTWNTGDYLASPMPLRLILANLTFIGFPDRLPGVFTTLPYAGAVDSSLWTLRYEVICYGGVLLLGVARMLRPVPVGALLAGLLVAEHLRWGGSYVMLAIPFAAGALIELVPIRLDGRAALACAVLVLVALVTRSFNAVGGTLGTYVVLWFAIAWLPVPDPAARFGDLSYGLYIWAFPVEQVIVSLLGSTATPLRVAALALAPTIGLAWLSWHVIEAPALRLKPPRGTPPGRVEQTLAEFGGSRIRNRAGYSGGATADDPGSPVGWRSRKGSRA